MGNKNLPHIYRILSVKQDELDTTKTEVQWLWDSVSRNEPSGAVTFFTFTESAKAEKNSGEVIVMKLIEKTFPKVRTLKFL